MIVWSKYRGTCHAGQSSGKDRVMMWMRVPVSVPENAYRSHDEPTLELQNLFFLLKILVVAVLPSVPCTSSDNLPSSVLTCLSKIPSLLSSTMPIQCYQCSDQVLSATT
jgi:hypothetical protein